MSSALSLPGTPLRASTLVRSAALPGPKQMYEVASSIFDGTEAYLPLQKPWT
jgi:hypothetical protein